MRGQENKARLNKLLSMDNTHPDDVERRALFYLISGNDELFNQVEMVYDFGYNGIKPDCFEREDLYLSSSATKLLRLGFNLFNVCNPADVLDTFYILDEYNFSLAMNALKIRFKKSIMPI